MTDRSDRLAGIEKGLNEAYGLIIHAEGIGIDHAARQQQRVEVFRACAVERHINRKVLAPIREVPAAHPIALGRYDISFGTGLVERMAGFKQFDLLEPIRNKYRNLFAVKLSVRHCPASFR